MDRFLKGIMSLLHHFKSYSEWNFNSCLIHIFLINNFMEKIENLRDEEKLLSLFCHFSVFFGGLVVPVIIWAYQKDKSKFVRFHALQSIFSHLLFSLIIAVITVLFVGVAFATNISAFEHAPHSKDMPPLLIGMIIVFAFFIIIMAFAFIGFSIYWGIKAYHGYAAKIPFVGNIVYKKVYGENPSAFPNV